MLFCFWVFTQFTFFYYNYRNIFLRERKIVFRSLHFFLVVLESHWSSRSSISVGLSEERLFVRRLIENAHISRLYSYYCLLLLFFLFFFSNCPADIQCPVSILGFFISSCQRNSRPRGSKAKRPPVQLKRTEMEHYGPIQFCSHKRTKLPAVYFRNRMLSKAYTNTVVNEIYIDIL